MHITLGKSLSEIPVFYLSVTGISLRLFPSVMCMMITPHYIMPLKAQIFFWLLSDFRENGFVGAFFT